MRGDWRFFNDDTYLLAMKDHNLKFCYSTTWNYFRIDYAPN